MSSKKRKRNSDVEDQNLHHWEKDHVLPDVLKHEIRTMWEIPQIFHFFYLTKDVLEIPHLSMYEMERMLLIPRASKRLAAVMTALLSSPIGKTKIRKVPPMPYEFWTNVLTHKVKGWFKVYSIKKYDPIKVFETTGIEPEFWEIFPDVSHVIKKDFAELTLKQRIWLVKTMCDTIMHTRKSIHHAIEKQKWEEQFETVLGVDRYGTKYIYFPQFLDTDLRVYRYSLSSCEISDIKEEPKQEVKAEDSDVAAEKPKRKKRRVLWKNIQSRRKSRRNKIIDEDVNDCKDSVDNGVKLSENCDKNFSNDNACDNSNHSELRAVSSKRARSSSESSEGSVLSRETKCTSTKSSDCDISGSNHVKNCNDESSNMFKGFDGEGDMEKKNISTIRGILNGLTSEVCSDIHKEDSQLPNSASITKKKKKRVCIDLNVQEIPDRLNDDYISRHQDLSAVASGSKSSIDANSLSTTSVLSKSKTDDEKLIEIGTNDSSMVKDKIWNQKSETQTSSIACKSDDEKLIETKYSGSEIDIVNDKKSVLDVREKLNNTMDKLPQGNQLSEKRNNEAEEEIVLNQRIDKLENIATLEHKENATEDKNNENKKIVLPGKDDITRTSEGKGKMSDDDTLLVQRIIKVQKPTTLEHKKKSIQEKDKSKKKVGLTREYVTRRKMRLEQTKSKLVEQSNSRPHTKLTHTKSKDQWEKSSDEFQEDLVKEGALKNDRHSEDEDSHLEEFKGMLPSEKIHDAAVNYNSISSGEKNIQTHRPQEEIDSFKELLSDLSVSTFELVADSVQSLKEFLLTFSVGAPTDDSIDDDMPLCEALLLKKLQELFESVVSLEPELKHSTIKARKRLYCHWVQYREDVEEDQDEDWSGEGGLGSNWWVLGSQGCPLLSSGEATLRTISEPAMSKAGPNIQIRKSTDEVEEEVEVKSQPKQWSNEDQSCEKKNQGKEACKQDEGRSPNIESKECKEEEGETAKDKQRGAGQQSTGRVLRARGVPSYTEQYFSDDESEEDQLDAWTDFKTIYQASSQSPSTPASDTLAQSGQSNDESEEDSDKDWILPGTRKRKYKRRARQLTTFHRRQFRKYGHVESIEKYLTTNAIRSTESSLKESQSTDSNDKLHVWRKSSNFGRSIKAKQEEKRGDLGDDEDEDTPKRIIIHSIHSELDIKDEGPVTTLAPSEATTNFVPQGFVVVKTDQTPANYYLMNPSVPGLVQQTPVMQQRALMQQGALVHQGTILHQGAIVQQGGIVHQGTIMQPGAIVQSGAIMAGVLPQVAPGYYVQDPSNFVVQSTQTNFVSSQDTIINSQNSQQVVLHPTASVMGSQQFMNPSSYVHMPYIAGSPAQTSFIPTTTQSLTPRSAVTGHIIRQSPPVRFASNSEQGKPVIPRADFRHPNGAVIRSSLPIRRTVHKTPGHRPLAPRSLTSRNSTFKGSRERRTIPVTKASSDSGPSKTTSLIVLSDGDDEIEMIIPAKSNNETVTTQVQNAHKRKAEQQEQRERPVFTLQTVTPTTSTILHPIIMERLNQGEVSITPIKPAPPPIQSPGTQLVVVVNETGSHYALALPNGSKIILTPDQIAQIRASNGGKLIL